MFTTEGKGLIPPSPIRVRLDRSDVSLALREARRRTARRRYGDRADQWGQGLLGADSSKSVWVGFLGEIAFAKWTLSSTGILISPDFTYRPLGDGGTDFVLNGCPVQVKTATTDYRELLVRTADAALPADVSPPIYVRAHWQSARHRRVESGGLFGTFESRDLVVELCGWVWGIDLLRFGTIQKSRIGPHENYSLPPERFRRMACLAEYLNAKSKFQEKSRAQVGVSIPREQGEDREKHPPILHR